MDNTQPTYPVSMTDHDLLIRLDQKMNQLSEDMKGMKDGLSSRVAILESKAIAYDQLLVEYPPAKNVEQLRTNTKWIDDFKLTWRIILGMSIGVSSVITFILMALGQVFHIVGFFGK